MTFTVTDDDGGIGTDTAIVTVLNVAPTADAGADQTANEGDLVTLNGNFSDPGSADTYTRNWHIVAINGQVIGDGSGSNFSFTPNDNGIYTVTFTVADDDAGVGTDTAIVTVLNVAPTVNAGLDQTVNVGQLIVLNGTFTDPGSADSHTLNWHVAASNGQVIADGSGDSFQFIPGSNGTYAVTFTVTDDDGATGTDSALVISVDNSGTNSSPVFMSLVSSSPDCGDAGVGTPVTISGSYTDFDASDLHHLLINWGDGTTTSVNENDSGINQVSDTFSVNHAYASGGVFTLAVTLFDNNGGSAARNWTAVISGVGLVNGQLQIIGTGGRDIIHVIRGGAGSGPDHNVLDVQTVFNVGSGSAGGGPATISDFSLSDVTSILIIGRGGDDHLQVHSQITIPATIDGGSGDDQIWGGDGDDTITDLVGNNSIMAGAGNDLVTTGGGQDNVDAGDGNDMVMAGGGNDTVTGGNGNDILVGGDGDDAMNGGDDYDLIIGGRGADTITGNKGEDLLIGGWTSFDDDLAALNAVMAEWGSNSTYAIRIGHLSGGAGGLNGSVFLHGNDASGGIGNQTVFDDNTIDRLTGSQGVDWFLANIVADNSPFKDIITDLANSEAATDIDLNLL